MNALRDFDRVIVNTGGEDVRGVVISRDGERLNPALKGSALVQFENSEHAQWIPHKYIRPEGALL